MIFRLYPKDDCEVYLPPKHIACLLAQSIPTITIDWAKGNEHVLSKLYDLVALRAPDVVLNSHKSLFDETAVVEASFPKFPGKRLSFFVQPESAIQIENESPEDEEFIQFAVEFIASILGYGWKQMS